MQQEIPHHSYLAHQTPQGQKKSFIPYQRRESSKRLNPFILDESGKLEPQPYKTFKTENNFVLIRPPQNQMQYNLYASVPNLNPLQALMFQNEVLALQLQKEYYQQRLYNQVQNLVMIQKSLQLSPSMKPEIEEPKPEAKKIESPSKVIVIDDNDDCHSDSAETNITEGFCCSPTIHITCEEQELEGEQQPQLERETRNPKDQTALIPKLSLNIKNNNSRRRNLKLRWNPETMDRTKLEKFMEDLSRILRRRISNEQTVIAILQFFDMDTEKALSTIKRNKPEYQNLFNISLRNTRRTTNC